MKLARLAAAALLFVALPAAAANLTGKPAPKLTAATLDGQTFDTSAAKGKVVIVSFWATWCAPCQAEMPALDAYYQAHKAEGLQLVAISLDDPAKDKAVARIMKPYSFPGAHGRDSHFDAYGHPAFLPVAYVIDRSGVVRWDGAAQAQPVAFDAKSLDATVTPLLKAH